MKKIIATVVMVLAIIWIVPFRLINWGKIAWVPAETVTVMGEAKTTVKNQIASFNAGVDVLSNTKEEATKEINSKMEALVVAMKGFGIGEADIRTQSLSYYQQEEPYWENGVQRYKKGQWRVSSSIEVKLREIDRASELAGVLAGSGANNVYGPNFQLDDTTEAEKGLFEEAVKNAKDKAELVATATGRKLGKVLSVSEGGASGGIYPVYGAKMAEGGGGAPMEAGAGTVYKSVTVVFELK
ncbi:MAG: SIMPL domain-containing protein [Candidatus Shapirobacteria bacterium]|jgi:hypothetical protein